MLSKGVLTIVITGVVLLNFSSTVFAELFSVSAGIPVSYSLTDTKTMKSDGQPSGILIHAKLPIMVGLGYESYQVPLKSKDVNDKTDYKLNMTMYDLFYQLPVPVVNITLGIGTGITELECTEGAIKCSDVYKKGTATQFYGQFGVPILAVWDLHFSYHSIKSTLKPKDKHADDVDTGGTMIALGMSFGF